MESDINTMKEDLRNVKDDIRSVKTDIQQIKDTLLTSRTIFSTTWKILTLFAAVLGVALGASIKLIGFLIR